MAFRKAEVFMGKSTRYYAHTPEDNDRPWQTLEDHLNNVACLASGFASKFGATTWGYALGILHDAGKATDAFQRRLRGSSGSVDHSTAGAKMAVSRYDTSATLDIGGRLMAYAVAGHHGGMPDGTMSNKAPSLRERLAAATDQVPGFERMLKERKISLPGEGDLEPLPCVRRIADVPDGKGGLPSQEVLRLYGIYSTSFFTRMLFSSLVDADYLDTEEYVRPELTQIRNNTHSDLIGLDNVLKEYMTTLEDGAPDTTVNRARASILEDSLATAEEAPGVFTMTTPTGGGKTLASMAFALEHAVRYGMDRVIVAIPFTSIVEQTAEVLRGIFGRENVLEHHSNYDFEADDPNDPDSALRERLAVQNWDAPIIVTTNVQLLESLYSNRPGKCRKLHNVARSVIVLDEAQTIPDGVLMPSLAALEELTLDYGSSVVLCTATQPAVDELWPFGSSPRPIVLHTEGLDTAFGSRTRFVVRGQIQESLLVDELAGLNQALCIVGTKAKARRLYEEILDDTEGGEPGFRTGVFHLSASMVPAHRSRVIGEVRRRLATGERCLVISTQLVEAGVDVDFPVVYRELAGIDSLFQAAGRCNRNGRLRDERGRPKVGEVNVFELVDDEGSPDSQDMASNWLNRMKAISRQLIGEHGGTIDDSMVPEFFERRYRTGNMVDNLDGARVYRDLTDGQLLADGFASLSFRSYAERFKIIADDTTPVFAPWETEGRRLYGELMQAENPTAMAMRLQRYSVSVRPYELSKLEAAGAIETFGQISVLRMEDDCRSFYSDEVGLLPLGQEKLNTMLV